ncbi:hypothetical protein TIFTF001_032030 [Ficus carica]|uniref:Uncharacterized protein n=1 Tax=Ficus carica TaxID=3494 RepID=A0AA88DVW1_FICCA|nr:hypothetical protein TIFTF001_031988 [Ficus carica]GMN62938.1 hypothetical protein TIFTF001_032030 [Ficus carica]
MSKPTKMSEKNTTLKRRSVRTASAYKRPSAEESSKKPSPEIERMVSDEGLMRKQGEIEVKDSKKLINAVEEKISEAEEVFHNIVMRLTDHSGMGDALCFEMSNANFDNDDDAVKLSLLCMIFYIPLSNANSEATRAAICNTVENMISSKRIPLKKFDKVHYSIVGFPHALLVWTYETLPSIAAKFTTKYDQAISRMLSWITTDNAKFDDVMSTFTTVGENQETVVEESPFLFRHSAQLEKLCFSHIDTPALSEQISYQIAPTTVPYAAVRPHPPPVLVNHHSCKS